MKLVLGLIFGLIINVVSTAQDFRGMVLDQETNKPVMYAEIYIVDLNTGTVADERGSFDITHFDQKNLHIQISSIGYKTLDTIINLIQTQERTFYLAPSHYQLEEAIVSVEKGKLGKQSIVSVDHRKIEYIQQTAPLTLAEGLASIPGVEQNTTGVGIGKPVIRGLTGNRIVTYAQGIRIENQQWGDEHGLGVGEIGIESVEVIKGPASLLYGSDALGGVLYFIDERYAKHNTYEIKGGTKVLSNTLGTMTNLGMKLHRGSLKLNIFGGYSSHGDYQVAGKKHVENTRFDEKNIKISLGYNTDNWVSNMRYSYLENNFGITEDTVYLETSKRSFQVPFQTIDNHNLSFENLFFIKDSKLSTTLGYTSNYRREFEDDSDFQSLGLLLSTTSYNFKWHSPSYQEKYDFVIGSQGMIQTNKNNGEELLIPDAKTEDLGVFVLGNLTFAKLQCQAGLRVDQRKIGAEVLETTTSLNKKYQGITYSVGVAYTRGTTKYRMNLSSGYRAPNTAELLSNGVHEGTNRFERGNASLNTERATQFDFSVDYTGEHLKISMNPFYNYINQYIYLSPADTLIDSQPVYDYRQTNAYLTGGEFGFHYHPHQMHGLHLASDFSSVFANDDQGNPLPLIPQVKVNNTVSYEFVKKKKVHVSKIHFQYIHKFEQNQIGQFETPTAAYSLLNAGMKIKMPSKTIPLEIDLGAKNILNTKYTDHLSRFKAMEIPNPGINIYVNIQFKVNYSIHPDTK